MPILYCTIAVYYWTLTLRTLALPLFKGICTQEIKWLWLILYAKHIVLKKMYFKVACSLEMRSVAELV